MIQKHFFFGIETNRAKKGVVSRLPNGLTDQKKGKRSRVTTPFKIVQAIHLFSRLFCWFCCHVSCITYQLRQQMNQIYDNDVLYTTILIPRGHRISLFGHQKRGNKIWYSI